MENIQIQEDGKWIYLVFDKTKVIGQTQKGGDKVASAQWEKIPGTNLKVLVQVIVAKEKKEKASAVEDTPAPKRNKDRTKNKEVEVEPSREKRNKNKNKNRSTSRLIPDEEVVAKKSTKNTKASRRPTRPDRPAKSKPVDANFDEDGVPF